MAILKCARCGLKLETHTSAKCNEILYLERSQLIMALEEVSQGIKAAKQMLDWVKNHKSHEVLKNDPLFK